MSTNPMLPEQFADLEPFAKAWSLPREHDRYERRLASSMEELQAFYNAAAPRAEEAQTYLDQFDLDDLPERELNLLRLFYSLITVSFAVDVFRQPRIPDSGKAYLDVVVEPVP
jgi:hypothetical protein